MKCVSSSRALFLALVLCLPVTAFAASKSDKAPQWEYQVISAKLNQRPLEQLLNAQAAQGWELVQITDRSLAIFRKRVR